MTVRREIAESSGETGPRTPRRCNVTPGSPKRGTPLPGDSSRELAPSTSVWATRCSRIVSC